MRIPVQYSAAPDLGRTPQEPTQLQLVEPSPPPPPPAEEDLVKELDRALGEKEQLLADFDNYRRHAESRLETARRDATHEVLAELGDAIGSLELAASVNNEESDSDAVREGLSLVARGIKAIFDRHRLERIPTEGHPFDPRIHEAVLVERQHPPEVEKGTVLRELSPGFRSEQRVVRPARVAVAG